MFIRYILQVMTLLTHCILGYVINRHLEMFFILLWWSIGLNILDNLHAVLTPLLCSKTIETRKVFLKQLYAWPIKIPKLKRVLLSQNSSHFFFKLLLSDLLVRTNKLTKFQDPTSNSYVNILLIRKAWQTNGQIIDPKAIRPSNSFKVGGINVLSAKYTVHLPECSGL